MGPFWLWPSFLGLVLVLVAIDLGVNRRHHGPMPRRRALGWSAVWIGIAMAFAGLVALVRGGDAAIDYLTGYVLEKSLSVDNLFVFLLLFRHFRVPEGEQHRVLTWGILGALVFRGALIIGGVELIQHYRPAIYVLGAFLVLTGIRTLVERPERRKPIDQTRLVRGLRKVLHIVPEYHGGKFVIRRDGRLAGTLLLLVLAVVELTDVVFAVDSIPAIFAITDDTFIVFSSNILALLGLRALYFALVDLFARLRYLRFGLGTILILIGIKMALHDLVHVPPVISLAMTLFVLGVTILASLLRPATVPAGGAGPRRGGPGPGPALS
jgi:tellurite resistance protein TerC